jgi:hypothetical protein
MHRSTWHVAIAALLTSLVSGCGDFLQGPAVDEDPNNPTTEAASADNFFAGFQASQFGAYTNPLTVSICGWVQQCRGVNGRFVQDQLIEYNVSPLTFDGTFQQIYGQGGLKDLGVVREKLALKPTPDLLYDGILKVWEALVISSAADKWGAIPYSEAAGDALTPVLDPQTSVYAAAVALLDQAITQFADPTAGPGPGTVDFVYAGDPASWTAMAHTLKARILLHQIRAQCAFSASAGSCPAYAPIAAEALLGIPIGGADFTTVVSGGSALESNGWFQFYSTSGFGTDLRAGEFFVNLLNTRNAGGQDPRFDEFFEFPDPSLPPSDPANADGPFIARSKNNPAFSQPWVTAYENALILAEAQFYTGDVGGATAQVNAVRADVGLPALGPVTLAQIIEEKYVALFQNPEAWNDYKRTCLPALTPTASPDVLAGPIPNEIPRRVYYGQTEADVNPNIPSATAQTTSGEPNLANFRNPNDPPPPQGCTPITL